MSAQEHTAECRKRLEDVMTTATRVRQAERIIRNSNDPGVANPSSLSGSGQQKRVRFADQELPDPKPEHDNNWNPGPRRGNEGALEKQIAGKWHVITLQEAFEYVDRGTLSNRFHVTR